ncbi:MAG: hypothetical protein ACRC1H_01880, partial [Caldilineaceae bacterium]
ASDGSGGNGGCGTGQEKDKKDKDCANNEKKTSSAEVPAGAGSVGAAGSVVFVTLSARMGRPVGG